MAIWIVLPGTIFNTHSHFLLMSVLAVWNWQLWSFSITGSVLPGKYAAVSCVQHVEVSESTKMGYRHQEQTVWFESLLIHRVSPLYGLQPVFLWLLLFLRSGPVARTWLCFQCFDLPLHLPTEKGWLAARCMSADWNRKYTLYILLCVLMWWKLDLLLHASVDKEVCFLSGWYICSCQQGGQEIAFDLTVIRLNMFGHSVWPPMISYQGLSSVLV